MSVNSSVFQRCSRHKTFTPARLCTWPEISKDDPRYSPCRTIRWKFTSWTNEKNWVSWPLDVCKRKNASPEMLLEWYLQPRGYTKCYVHKTTSFCHWFCHGMTICLSLITHRRCLVCIEHYCNWGPQMHKTDSTTHRSIPSIALLCSGTIYDTIKVLVGGQGCWFLYGRKQQRYSFADGISSCCYIRYICPRWPDLVTCSWQKFS